VNRRAQAVVMLLLGGAVVKASVSDMFLRYVKAGLRPLLITAGVLLIVAAVMTLWYDFRPAKQLVTAGGGPDHDGHEEHRDPDDDGHGHAHHEPQVGWLGSYSAGQAGTVLTSQNSVSDYPVLAAGDPVELGLLDYASRAVFDQGKSLTGRNLKLTGFITPGPDHQPMLARIILTCCAADARPIKIGLAGNLPAGVKADTWVTIVGTYIAKTGKDPVNHAAVPYVEVKTWQETATPSDQYEPAQPYQ
jgi:hypothetical protein